MALSKKDVEGEITAAKATIKSLTYQAEITKLVLKLLQEDLKTWKA